jgi:hypothetical protein
MSEALKHHVKEGETLQRQNLSLSDANKTLMQEKQVQDVIVREKIVEAKNKEKMVRFCCNSPYKQQQNKGRPIRLRIFKQS